MKQQHGSRTKTNHTNMLWADDQPRRGKRHTGRDNRWAEPLEKVGTVGEKRSRRKTVFIFIFPQL